jgi:hypothetical protein
MAGYVYMNRCSVNIFTRFLTIGSRKNGSN